jgi:ABC-2 type transport system ATP-binding protein
MEDLTLKVSNLCKSYPEFRLSNINFELRKGMILGLIGANGAGKSTTVRCVTGQTPFEQGVITLGGVPLTEDPKRFKQSIRYVGESTDIYDHVRARALYQFVRQFYYRWDDQRFWQLMTDFDLNVNQKIKQYSKGMRVRLHLAIALSHRADVLIMDEPTTGLDPLVRNQLLEILILSDEAHRNGASVLFSTHITEDVQKIATDVCFMAGGSIILEEEVSSIQDKYLELQGLDGCEERFRPMVVRRFRNRAIVRRSPELSELLLASPTVASRKLSLDDLLIALIERGANSRAQTQQEHQGRFRDLRHHARTNRGCIH